MILLQRRCPLPCLSELCLVVGRLDMVLSLQWNIVCSLHSSSASSDVPRGRVFADLLRCWFENSFYVYCDTCFLCDPSYGICITLLLYTCTYRHHETGLRNVCILLIASGSLAAVLFRWLLGHVVNLWFFRFFVQIPVLQITCIPVGSFHRSGLFHFLLEFQLTFRQQSPLYAFITHTANQSITKHFLQLVAVLR